jgi:hypothetical protein
MVGVVWPTVIEIEFILTQVMHSFAQGKPIRHYEQNTALEKLTNICISSEVSRAYTHHLLCSISKHCKETRFSSVGLLSFTGWRA